MAVLVPIFAGGDRRVLPLSVPGLRSGRRGNLFGLRSGVKTGGQAAPGLGGCPDSLRASPVCGGYTRTMATLGIDIGCISVKIAVVGGPEDRELFWRLASESTLFHDPTVEGRTLPHPGAPPVLATAYRRIKGNPADTTRDLLGHVLAALPERHHHRGRCHRYRWTPGGTGAGHPLRERVQGHRPRRGRFAPRRHHGL